MGAVDFERIYSSRKALYLGIAGVFADCDMVGKTAAAAGLLITMVFQGVVAYIVANLDVSSVTGQQIAGLIFALDALLFAYSVRLYHRSSSPPVYGGEGAHE